MSSGGAAHGGVGAFNLEPVNDGNAAAQVSQTTQEGYGLMNNALQERIRFAKPETFEEQPDLFYADGTANRNVNEHLLRHGGNINAPDPAKYVLPSAAKDRYNTRQEIIEEHRAQPPPAAGAGAAIGTYSVGTNDEINLRHELEAQKRILEYDKYCASMFNYKNIPGGLKALEEINPGFTARRIAQVYSDLAYAGKNKCIDVLGQANCGMEANMFKFDVDNGIIHGPALLGQAPKDEVGYVEGGIAQLFRKKFIETNPVGTSSTQFPEKATFGGLAQGRSAFARGDQDSILENTLNNVTI